MRSVTVVCIALASMLGQSLFAESNRSATITWEADYAKAQRTRQKAKRPMLVFISMESCHYCQKMLDETYSDTKVIRTVSNLFIPTYLNASKDAGLAKAFKVRIFPTTVLVDAENRIVDRIEGYATIDKLTKRLDKAKVRHEIARRK